MIYLKSKSRKFSEKNGDRPTNTLTIPNRIDQHGNFGIILGHSLLHWIVSLPYVTAIKIVISMLKSYLNVVLKYNLCFRIKNQKNCKIQIDNNKNLYLQIL